MNIMKRYLLHFVVTVVTFSIGVLLASFWLFALFVTDIKVEQPPLVKVEPTKLTFDCSNHSGILSQLVSTNGVIGSPCQSSDGSSIFVGTYGDTFTKKTANLAFENAIKHASNIVSNTAILDNQGNEIGRRVLIQNKENVKILKILKVDEKYFFKPYIVSEIQAQDFKNALAYEKQEIESIKRQKYTSFENN
jgi:hypothetical protein